MVGLHFSLAWISPEFGIERDLIDKPVAGFVALELAAGAVFLLAIYGVVAGSDQTPRRLLWIILAGLGMRLAMIASMPMLESDFFRYLWDGAVVANGMNPYRYAPEQVVQGTQDIPPELINLAANSGEVIHRINYPHLKTVYPPVAQAAFALAYCVKPWSLFAWRLVLALFDSATVVLLFVTLRGLHLPREWLVVYWWNPLVLREGFNAAHMDILALPLVIAALFIAVRGWYAWAAVLLALGTCTKIWPVVLLPMICVGPRKTLDRLVAIMGVFGFTCCLLFVPVYWGGLDSTSGMIAYGREWEMNDALYMALCWIAAGILKTFSPAPASIHLIARMVSLAILSCCIAVLCRGMQDSSQLWERSLLAVAALFMLSPTQFPWYYLWAVPLLAIRPRLSLLMLGVLLPLYYLRFHFKARGGAEIFDTYVVWFEYVPVWILCLVEAMTNRTFLGRSIREAGGRGWALPPQ